MKSAYKFILSFIVLCGSVALFARNPFEFADEQLKKYVPVKIEKIEKTKEQHQKWKITETKNETTHIVEDHEGNVRAISLSSKN